MTATFDSGAWIEFFSGTPSGKLFGEVVSSYDMLFSPSVVLMEVKCKCLRDGVDWKPVIAYMKRRSTVVEIDEELALLAAEMKHRHRLHTVDAIVYAVAESTDTRLYTTDAHFRKLPRTVLLGKR